MIFLPWAGIVELARAIEGRAADTGVIDTAGAIRLARAVLFFQNRMLAGLVRAPGSLRELADMRDEAESWPPRERTG